MLSLNANTNPLQNLHIGTVVSQPTLGGDKTPQSLKDVIDQLAQALTKGGHLDKESPLGQMVGKQMEKNNPLASLIGGNPDMIKAALGDLIKDKLGENFGAAADAGQAGAGAPDLMSQTLNGLAKASLDDLLTKTDQGTTFSKGDMPLLEKIAEFMDQRTAQDPQKFPAPDSGSWKNELTAEGDNFLDGKETAAFRSALDSLGSQLGQEQNGLSDAGSGSPLSNLSPTDPSGGAAQTPNSVNQDLGQLLGDLLQKGVNASVGGGLGTPMNDASQSAGATNSVTQDLGQLLSGLIKKGLEAEQNGAGVNGAGGQTNPFAQQDQQNMLAQAATALVSALVGGGNNSNSLS
ncbi:harpin HrpZ family protein [Pseudomonas sp. CFBP 13711]|uniref:harpin HrpZ family protein n=1 Tax=unclassified Pseudomonas TaxID=196821 RepID=UPI0017874C6C|nr:MULTISPECIES: harpin HrpZ family protein [unclassified Pseudomonas]MBD8709915.1 harpin HrpZ family protein [Pseudomonas sp. CFBP 13711]MBD8715138.1 harpin HrpZ family protein [Pseudomonas sp. CFBP 13715]